MMSFHRTALGHDYSDDSHWVLPKEQVRRVHLGPLARPGSKVLYPYEGRKEARKTEFVPFVMAFETCTRSWRQSLCM